MYGRRIFCFHNSGLKVCYSRSPHHSCGCGSGVHLGSSSVALSFAFLPVEEVSHKKGRGQGPDNKSARFALLHNGSPFGDPGPHGDLFRVLGPLFMFWVPFFNGLVCLSRWPSHFTKDWLNGFSASWESSICERKLHYPGNRTQDLLQSGEIRQPL